MNREIAQRAPNFVEFPTTRRALSKQRTRERLLDAARRLFTERGYEAATVRDIASAADLSTGAVFASFTDKADLFNAVLIADHQALAERMAALDVSDLSTREALLRLMGLAYERHSDQLGLVQAAISFSWQRDLAAETRNRQGLKLVLALLAGVISRGIEQGELGRGTGYQADHRHAVGRLSVQLSTGDL